MAVGLAAKLGHQKAVLMVAELAAHLVGAKAALLAVHWVVGWAAGSVES